MLKLEILNGCNVEYDENSRITYFAMPISHDYRNTYRLYYDDKGRVVKLVNRTPQQHHVHDAPDVYTYTYDDNDRIISITKSNMGIDILKTVYEYTDSGVIVTHESNYIKQVTRTNLNNDIIDDTYTYPDGMINHLSREYNYDDKTFIEKIEMVNTKLEEDIYESISKYSFENDEVKLIEKIKE